MSISESVRNSSLTTKKKTTAKKAAAKKTTTKKKGTAKKRKGATAKPNKARKKSAAKDPKPSVADMTGNAHVDSCSDYDDDDVLESLWKGADSRPATDEVELNPIEPAIVGRIAKRVVFNKQQNQLDEAALSMHIATEDRKKNGNHSTPATTLRLGNIKKIEWIRCCGSERLTKILDHGMLNNSDAVFREEFVAHKYPGWFSADSLHTLSEARNPPLHVLKSFESMLVQLREKGVTAKPELKFVRRSSDGAGGGYAVIVKESQFGYLLQSNIDVKDGNPEPSKSISTSQTTPDSGHSVFSEAASEYSRRAEECRNKATSVPQENGSSLADAFFKQADDLDRKAKVCRDAIDAVARLAETIEPQKSKVRLGETSVSDFLCLPRGTEVDDVEWDSGSMIIHVMHNDPDAIKQWVFDSDTPAVQMTEDGLNVIRNP